MRFKEFATLLIGCLSLFAFPVYSISANELLPEEKNTVEIFQKYSPKVIYVHRLKTITSKSSPPRQEPAGAGSGIIWDAKGHIVTNFHVINGADQLTITIGKLTVPARVIGTEPRKDIAVLAINSPKALAMLKTFVPFALASTEHLMVGQKTIAIGNPYGLDHSLSVGVISALRRKVPGAGGVALREMIQTDTSINPGNSGGPLLDSKGRLIGINTAIFSNSGSSAGVGFAVPANDLARIVPQIIKNGRVILSGIGVKSLPRDVIKRLGVKKGIVVGAIIPNTPAAKAGLKGTYHDTFGRLRLGDVIVALNDHSVKNYDSLYYFLANVRVGEGIKVTVLRQDRKLDFRMKTIDIAAY
ncbi:MAG: trypsin-like peptidase domain-containing protein [Tatlockia sp.]|nr:trypsin-like peptidase domain-containing protein [Tatlockia sp.]